MERLLRAVIVGDLVDRLRNNGSWCGETHIQKASFFLQEALLVSMDYDFILYKHGPFSFDLRDDLISFRADGILELEIQPPPYGPKLRTLDILDMLKSKYSDVIKGFEKKIDFVSEKLGNKGVGELERLGTALYVILRNPERTSAEDKASLISELKPHIPFEVALQAVNDTRKIIDEAKEI